MDQYYRCPMPQCPHRIATRPHSDGAEQMTDHLIDTHGLPVVSASYAAGHLLPIHAPQAA
ncbi:hypothetical protein ABZ135_34750 [Streptomyces sp. NPDC006339]|uniref:hypothetical protein n=1 Tax=Streptomyces sp. NPDC006339 TaxID=3156755 RepID=UPI0033B9FF59